MRRTSRKGTSRSTDGSRGRSSIRSPRMLCWISSVPPAIDWPGTDTRISATRPSSRRVGAGQHPVRRRRSSTVHDSAAAGDAAAGQLAERALGPGRPAPRRRRRRAPAVQRLPSAALRTRATLLADDRSVASQAGGLRPTTRSAPAGALRVPARRSLKYSSPPLAPPRGAARTAGPARPAPAPKRRSWASVVSATRQPVADGADDVGGGHAGVGEEHLVERRVAVHLAQRPDLDAGLVHRQHEVRDALVLGHVPVGAGQQHAVVGVVGAGVPHLLAVDDPLVAVALGPGRESGEVGAAPRLAEELAPDVLAEQRRAEERRLSVVGAVLEDRRRRQTPSHAARRGDGAELLELLGDHVDQTRADAAAAPLRRRTRAGPSRRRPRVHASPAGRGRATQESCSQLRTSARTAPASAVEGVTTSC